MKIHLAGWYFAVSLRGEKLLRGIWFNRTQLQGREEGPAVKQAAPSRGQGAGSYQPLCRCHPALHWKCLLASLLIKSCFLFLLINLLNTTPLLPDLQRPGRGSVGRTTPFASGQRETCGAGRREVAVQATGQKTGMRGLDTA